MNRWLTGVAIACVFLSPRLLGQTSVYEFLQGDVGPRAAALSGSFVSMTNDPASLFYNPASLTTIDRPRTSLGYFKHLGNAASGHAVYAQQLRNFFLAAGVVYMDYGTMTRTDASSNVLGEFGAHDLAFSAGAGLVLDEGLSAGVAIKFISSSIADYHSRAMAFDAGILYDLPAQRLTLGASIQNLGQQLKTFAGKTESLPLDFRIGVTTRPEHLPVLLNLNFHKLTEDADNILERFNAFSVGVEFLMSESLRLRAGYNNEQRRELKLGTSAGLLGFSFGGGLVVRDYQIDYAYSSLGQIGGFHRFGLAMAL